MAHLEQTPEVPETPDEWHVHAAAEGPAQEEHGSTVNTILLFMAFLGSVGSIALVVLLTYVYYTSYANHLRRTRIETTTLAEDYIRYRNDWNQMAQDFAWIQVENDAQLVMPLQMAMERVLDRYQGPGGQGSQGGGGQERSGWPAGEGMPR
jgi:hypothetical protein